MKRNPSLTRLVPALACGLLLTTACHRQSEFEYIDEVVVPESTDEPNVTVTDEDGNETTLPSGSTIGIYVIGEDGTVTLQQVEVDEDGNAILPATGEGQTVIAYTPYQEEWGDSALVTTPTFTVEPAQTTLETYAASDLLIGKTGETTRAAEGGMTFQHTMAQVAIHVVDETGRVNLNHLNAELLDLEGSVSVELINQKVNTIPGNRKNIQMLSEMTTDWRISSYAIVAPQSVPEGTEFYAITLYGNRETYPIPQASELEGGKTYTINLRLTAHGLIADGWSITDWNTESEQDIDVKI